MKKVCVLANSHVAMLKFATDATPPIGWEPTYFAAPHTVMRRLRLSRDKKSLVTRDPQLRKHLRATSGGQNRVNLNDYDAFLCVGLTIKFQTAFTMFQDFQPLEYQIDPATSLISEDGFKAAVRDRFQNTSGYKLLRGLSAQNRPVYFAPSPLPNATFLEEPGNNWTNDVAGHKALKWLVQVFDELSLQIAREHGAQLLPQPAETIVAGGLTDKKFQVGARGLTGQDYEKRDSTHMNADYGQKIIDDFTHALLRDRQRLYADVGNLVTDDFLAKNASPPGVACDEPPGDNKISTHQQENISEQEKPVVTHNETTRSQKVHRRNTAISVIGVVVLAATFAVWLFL